MHRLEELGEGGAAEVRHAQETQASRSKVLDGINGDDVSVLKPSQSQMLLRLSGGKRLAGGELEDHGAVAQGALACQENAPLSSAAQLMQDSEVAERFARCGKLGLRRRRAQDPLAFEKDL